MGRPGSNLDLCCPFVCQCVYVCIVCAIFILRLVGLSHSSTSLLIERVRSEMATKLWIERNVCGSNAHQP